MLSKKKISEKQQYSEILYDQMKYFDSFTIINWPRNDKKQKLKETENIHIHKSWK